MTKGIYPRNKYEYNYEPIGVEKGHTWAEDLPKAREKLIESLQNDYGKIDESKLKIEEIVF